MRKKEQKTVAVFFGGPSFEHEISVLTGVFTLNVLKNSGYDLIPVFLSTEGDFYSSEEMFSVKVFSEKKKFPRVRLVRDVLCRADGRGKALAKIDCALNCCHGGFGEGGGLSALLELYRIPLASPACAPSALFMDKILTKTVLAGLGIPSAPFTAAKEEDFLRDREKEMTRVEDAVGYPLIVKPSRLGSSIGVGVAKNREELEKKLETAYCFDTAVLVEKYIVGKRDINCAAYALGGEICVSRCEEPYSKEEILSFGEKYLEGGKERRSRLPADIPADAEKKIRAVTRKLYADLRLSGIVRADFLYADGEVLFNEMNTVPGSLAYYLFSEKLTKARELFCSLIEEAMSRAVREQKTVRLTGVLDKVGIGRKK